MRETGADTTQAVVLTVLLHAGLLLLLLAANWFRVPASAAAGSPITADLIDPNALSASMRAALRADPEPLPEPPEPAPVEEPLPEALPEETAEQQLQPQEQLPDPDTVDQQEARRDAISDEVAQREQEARQRQEQVDLTERQRQEEAQRKARDAELKDIQRAIAIAQREAKLSEDKLRQLADARARTASEAAAASPPPGQNGQSRNLQGAYALALQQAIRGNWTRPDNVSPSQVCKIVIRQIPGGQVVDAQVDPSCPYDEVQRRSVEAAVLKAQPLPYQGFESVFQRTLILNFRAEER